MKRFFLLLATWAFSRPFWGMVRLFRPGKSQSFLMLLACFSWFWVEMWLPGSKFKKNRPPRKPVMFPGDLPLLGLGILVSQPARAEDCEGRQMMWDLGMVWCWPLCCLSLVIAPPTKNDNLLHHIIVVPGCWHVWSIEMCTGTFECSHWKGLKRATVNLEQGNDCLKLYLQQNKHGWK